MLDLVIRGGQVVSPSGVGSWDVAIQGERIVALAEPGALTDDVVRVIDAGGKVVVPGGVDPHVHSKWPLRFAADRDLGLSAGPDVVSRAALFGGTTTLLDFATCTPEDTLEAAIERREAEWHGEWYADYSYHLLLRGGFQLAVLDQLPEAIAAGFPTVKLFTTDVIPHRRGLKVHYGEIWELLQRTAAHGGLALIHGEDDDIVAHMYAKLIREGRVGFEHMPEVHNTLSEDLAFRRVIRLAEHVEGAALYMVHVSAANGVEAIAEARAMGLPIYGETLHHYACLTSEAYRRPNGQIYHTYPSLKDEADRQSIWEGLERGPICTVATDGICTPLSVKVQGQRIDDTTGGHAGHEPRMGIIFTEAVSRRGLSLERFVDLTSANAARIMGLYPRKGALAPGSDADLAIIDPAIKRTLRNSDLHETDYSPWEGWQIEGWPVMTILRGKVVVEDGQFLAPPAYGQRLPRKIADTIFAGPIC